MTSARDTLRDLEDQVPFSLCCETCDDGQHIASREQAIAEGWTRIEFAPELAHANFIGLCPDCLKDDQEKP